MEELLRKQLLFQKIIAGLLALFVVIVLVIVLTLRSYVGQMADSLEEAMVKIEQIDVEAINDTVGTTQDLMNSVEDLSDAVDQVTGRVQQFDTWIQGLGIFQ